MYIDVVVNENDLDEDVSVLICDYKVQGRGKMHRQRFNNLAVEEIGRVNARLQIQGRGKMRRQRSNSLAVEEIGRVNARLQIQG